MSTSSKSKLLVCVLFPDDKAAQLPFRVLVDKDDLVADLKKAIKLGTAPMLDHLPPQKLTLYKVSIPNDDDLMERLNNFPLENGIKLDLSTSKLSEYFKEEPLKDRVHVVVQLPPAGEVFLTDHIVKIIVQF